MTSCASCGHEGSGSFCGNCGANLRGADETTSAANPDVGPSHYEGWQEHATYTGYQPYQSQPPRNQAPYRSAGAGGSGGSTPPAPQPPSNNRRGNQMLATLVGVAAVAVVALIAYLVLRPGSSNSTTATPSVSNSNTVATSSSASRNSAGPSENNGQNAPETKYATRTVQSPAPTDGGGSSMSLGDVPGFVSESGNYAIGRQGNSLTVYRDSGSGAQAISYLQLKGGIAPGVQKEYVKFVSLAGCSAPIIVWNSASASSSAAFGDDGTGNYQMFQNNGGYDLSPNGGDGSNAGSWGVYDRGDGYVTYRDSKGQENGTLHRFGSCSGNDLSYSDSNGTYGDNGSN